MAAAPLSLPKLIPSHPITRRLSQIHPNLLSSPTLDTILQSQNQIKFKGLCLNPDKIPISQYYSNSNQLLSPRSTRIAFPFIPQDAAAVGGEFGILEGRSFALIHPIVMDGLFLYTLYAGYLGWQWRRVQDEINVLKKQVKPAEWRPTALAIAS